MNDTEFIQHWNYLASLTERLDETKHYIDHGISVIDGELKLVHGDVYSDYFKQIIVLAASDFEVMSKALCNQKGKKADNIFEISECILELFPKIIESEINTPFWIAKPFAAWRIENNKKEGLEWWDAYNALKHDKENSVCLATLNNAVMALSSLYMIDLYLMYLIFGHMSVAYNSPIPYLKAKYVASPVSSGDGKLPDFGNLSAKETLNSKLPEFNKLNRS